MIDRMLHNWKPKLASLLVAIAVWYLFKENIRRQDQGPIVSDPGVLSASVSAPATGFSNAAADCVPGMATVPPTFGGAAPVASVVAERRQRQLIRLRWIDLGAFSGGIADYPAQSCA